MIPHRFAYHAPACAEAAVELLQDRPLDSVVLGGGTWVVPALGDPGTRVAQVVDLRRAGLDGIADHGDRVSLGATVTYTSLLRSPVVRRRLPLLTAVAEGVTGGPQIQNQGTIGGAACAGKPASDIPGALLTLEALAVVQGPGGRRTVPATRLWREPFRSALAADELLIGFDVAVRGGGSRDGFAYRKLKFGTSSWPIVTVGAVASLDEASVLARLTVGIGAAAAVPFQVPAQDLVGSAPTNDLAEEIAVRAKDALTDPWSDELAPAAYRTAVLPAVVRSVVAAALTRAAGSQEARSCPR